jgi:aryl-alcohol dehydrogenase-like predicted oxidoreductase
MEIRTVGRSGLRVSVAALGCSNFGRECDQAGSIEIVHAALDAGITFFDTASVYGGGHSEEHLGAALRGVRDDVVIATKFGVHVEPDGKLRIGTSRAEIIRSLDASLRRLGTDHVDLLQVHWPDPQVPIHEVLHTLAAAVAAGKARYIGHSNFAGWQVVDAAWAARCDRLPPFVSTQAHYNLLHREPESELLPACRAHGVGVLPYWPLASGFLTGKYRRDDAGGTGRLARDRRTGERIMSERAWRVLDGLTRVADGRGASAAAVALGWLAGRPGVASVIIGATRPDQVRENVVGCTLRLAVDEIAELEDLTTHDTR